MARVQQFPNEYYPREQTAAVDSHQLQGISLSCHVTAFETLTEQKPRVNVRNDFHKQTHLSSEFY